MTTTDAPPDGRGTVWRGLVVGAVLGSAFVVHPVLGIALAVLEFAWFSWLAERTGRPGLSTRLFLWAVVGAVAVAGLPLLVALTSSSAP